jgi:hypothetical protein
MSPNRAIVLVRDEDQTLKEVKTISIAVTDDWVAKYQRLKGNMDDCIVLGFRKNGLLTPCWRPNQRKLLCTDVPRNLYEENKALLTPSPLGSWTNRDCPGTAANRPDTKPP